MYFANMFRYPYNSEMKNKEGGGRGANPILSSSA